jgi:hypothetical protein
MTTSFVDQQVLVFVDSSVRDHSALVASISPDAEIIVFDGSRDGVAQISAALAGQSGVSAVHILSHGADGELDLGTTSLTADTLSTYADAIAGWSSALVPGADILLYGCNVAQSHIGQQFVQQIASLTSANVAASTDTTGAAALGGNWTLEYATGSIQADPVIPADVAYDGVLSVQRFATLNWTTGLTAPGPGVNIDFNLEVGFRADYPFVVVGGSPTDTVANGGIHVGSILKGPGGVDNLSFGDGTSIDPDFLVTAIIPDQDVLYGVAVTATGAPITHTYASTTANYVVEWDGTTRQSISNDAFHDQPWRDETIVDIGTGVTKSPTTTAEPILLATENTVNHIHLPSATFDNLVAVWRLGTAAEFIGSEPGFPLQFDPASAVAPPGLTLSSDGLITWDLTDNPGVVPGYYTVTAMLQEVVPGTQTVITETPYDALIEVVNGTPCYCAGTLIRTERGEKRVETLEIGDDVMTKAGTGRPIKWIGRRSYGGRFVVGRTDILPICIKAGALGDNVPKRDLWISPHHAMYFETADRAGVLIEARDLLNGVSIVQAGHVDKVAYFHIELDTHDVIIAEGAPSETFIDDDSRGMFHNSHEYEMLYADEVAQPACYCAPRRDEGCEVEAVRQRITRRAGLVRASDGPRIGGLRGYIDLVSETCVAGWAQNIDHPEAPVCLDILVNGQLIGQTLANRYREDLARAGLGSGSHSFEFTLPAEYAGECRAVEVRRSLDGALLARSSKAFVPGDSPLGRHIERRQTPDAAFVKVHRRAACQ